MNKKTTFIVHAAVIAALYVVLTLLANALGLANHAIQLRFSEALTILPLFTPAAIPGLFVGCILANFLTGALPWDVVFGSLATLIGAFGTYALKTYVSGKYRPLIGAIPPILSNTVIIPFVLAYVYCFEGSIPYFMLTVCIGEILSCSILGTLLYNTLAKYQKHLF